MLGADARPPDWVFNRIDTFPESNAKKRKISSDSTQAGFPRP
jgi:hypothetical protein